MTAIFFDSRAPIGEKPPIMAKKPGTNPKGEFAFFNVVYEDDSQRSNRRVPTELLGGLDGDEPARGFIMEQDREIGEKAGRPALAIKRSVGPSLRWRKALGTVPTIVKPIFCQRATAGLLLATTKLNCMAS